MFNINRKLAAAGLALALALPGSALAYGYKQAAHALARVEKDIANTQSFEVPAKGHLEVAFSPNEGSEHLVIKVIDSAKQEILMLAYSFTSPPITDALIRAVHRGVTVRLVADHKGNLAANSIAALSALKTAGGDVRTISAYPIAHDKLVLVDRSTVEQGSFNYSKAAAGSNSEQVLVNWDNPELAAVYVKHFERNYKQSVAVTTVY